jgi:hypothetical protein
LLRFEFRHPLIQPGGVRRGETAEAVLYVSLQILRIGGQLAHQAHQVFLHNEHAFRDERVFCRGPGQAKRCVEFIDAAPGFDARIGF